MDSQHAPPPAGLSSAEAARRLARDGANELPHAPRRTSARILGEVVREPMFQLLGAAVAIYLVLGSLGEAGVLLAFLAMIVLITVLQERRTERVLEALRDMTSPRARVRRDGQAVRIAGTQVVAGDLLELAEGDRVPADARLLQAHDLAADESMVTGESLPVAKSAGEEVFAGTLLVAGQALAEVTAIGASSRIGRIGVVLGSITPEQTPLHRQVRKLVRWFSVLGLGVSVAAALLYAMLRGDWLGGLLAGITLAMSMLPQEFLLILTVFMAMGAWRLSRNRVLTRRAATIEALGCTTVLCTDKTGTLTQNRMSVQALVRQGPQGMLRWSANANGAAPDGDFDALLQSAVLASEREPADAMEQAIHRLGQHKHFAPPPLDWALLHEYPLSSQRPAMTHVWRADRSAAAVVHAKGAPETVLRWCRLAPQDRAALLAEAARLAASGMRVLAVARAEAGTPPWPDRPDDLPFEAVGLLALADPLRPGAAAAVDECRRAGIRVLMITGDHAATAAAIAQQAGIDAAPQQVLAGPALAALDDARLHDEVAHVHVFARVVPHEKLRIVEALKSRGEVVAMVGDGVNDAPSLAAAHIGIAMGGRGTDVAREAASLVLLDDDLSTLVQGVRLGRRIGDNLRKAMRFVFAVHVPIAGLAVMPLALGWPLLFTPMHIAFLEIVIDPVCSIAFEAEAEEPDVMARPPRDPAAPLFSLPMIAASLLQGGWVLLAVGLFYGAMLQAGTAENMARTGAFVALVASNLGLVLVNRSETGRLRAVLSPRNRALWGMTAATAVLLAVVITVPMLRALFGFAWLDGATLAAALAVGAVVLLGLWAQTRLAAPWRQRGLATATYHRR